VPWCTSLGRKSGVMVSAVWGRVRRHGTCSQLGGKPAVGGARSNQVSARGEGSLLLQCPQSWKESGHVVFLDSGVCVLVQCLQWEGKARCSGMSAVLGGGGPLLRCPQAYAKAWFLDWCLQSVGTTHRCSVRSPRETCCRRVCNLISEDSWGQPVVAFDFGGR
jgi:hypothetical protein